MRLIYSLAPLSDGVLCITEQACADMYSFKQDKPALKEAGGLLLGTLFEGSSDIVVRSVTIPLRNDRRSRYRFFRSFGHTILAAKEWWKNDKTRTAVGSWHTHPEPIPHPSPQDFTDWVSISTRGRCPGEVVVNLIIGQARTGAWAAKNGEMKFYALQQQEDILHGSR